MNVEIGFRHCDPAGIVFYPRYAEMINDTVEHWFKHGLGMDFDCLHRPRQVGRGADLNPARGRGGTKLRRSGGAARRPGQAAEAAGGADVCLRGQGIDEILGDPFRSEATDRRLSFAGRIVALTHAPAQRRTGPVHGHGQGQHGEDDGAGLGVVEQREFEIQQLPQPARADEAQDGGHADVHLPAVQRVGQQLGCSARQGGIEEGHGAAAARQAQCVGGGGALVLQGLGIQAPQHAGRVQRQRQGACERTQPHGQCGEGGPDQLRHGAQQVEHQAAGRPPARQRQQQAQHGGQQGADHGDRQRSHTPMATLRSHSALVSGGKKLMTNSSMDRPAAPVNSEGRSISSMAKLAATPRARAVQMRALRQPQALARAAGGVSSARRRPRESRSAPQTSSMKVSKMVEASPPLSIFMAWSMSCPRPPAPTKPMTTEARMAHSQRPGARPGGPHPGKKARGGGGGHFWAGGGDGQGLQCGAAQVAEEVPPVSGVRKVGGTAYDLQAVGVEQGPELEARPGTSGHARWRPYQALPRRRGAAEIAQEDSAACARRTRHGEWPRAGHPCHGRGSSLPLQRLQPGPCDLRRRAEIEGDGTVADAHDCGESTTAPVPLAQAGHQSGFFPRAALLHQPIARGQGQRRVQRGHGFVGQDELGLLVEHAGNAHALQLPARELVAAREQLVGQVHAAQRLARAGRVLRVQERGQGLPGRPAAQGAGQHSGAKFYQEVYLQK
ncbi:hypothetical protein FQR65_LT20676 [Abscondita terminalis]|nr:hypothetical protein FQR65_LT20676 [Abscondita terminalis]